MIQRIGQIMLYVNHQDEAVKFWTEKVGFTMIAEESNEYGMKWMEIAPTPEAETSIILHDKEVIAKMSPGVNLGTPSLMLFTQDIEKLHTHLSNQGVTVGDIVEMPGMKVFNFADNEDNYFAVTERK